MNANNGELFCPGKLPFLLGNLRPFFFFTSYQLLLHSLLFLNHWNLHFPPFRATVCSVLSLLTWNATVMLQYGKFYLCSWNPDTASKKQLDTFTRIPKRAPNQHIQAELLFSFWKQSPPLPEEGHWGGGEEWEDESVVTASSGLALSFSKSPAHCSLSSFSHTLFLSFCKSYTLCFREFSVLTVGSASTTTFPF